MSWTTFESYLDLKSDVVTEINELCESRQDLAKALQRIESAVMPEDVPTISKLNDEFSDFAVSVSLIGQVKAGKTALANALLGVSDLLPSDVNPWTSVVTSVHLNRVAPKGKKAVFKFFDTHDWEDLVSNSGRIVELAKKAKLDSRVEELTAQIEDLKARTEQRLGRNFKLLLGNQHAFSSYSADLIKRYVCLGEDEMGDEGEGRFADLTKSADLFMDDESFPYPITLADTPGVNDPFLVREAATLENLRKSNVFVVVLSAHQALSSVDLGLLRLLKNLHSNRLIVFVNRIDELPDPHAQIKEIRKYVAGILRKQDISADVPVIFGSAAWADAAIRGDFENLPEDSIESLAALVDGRANASADDLDDISATDVSGISALRRAIHHKAWDEVFHTEITKIANRARNLVERSLIYLSKFQEDEGIAPDATGIQKGLDTLTLTKGKIAKTIAEFEKEAEDDLKMQMARAYVSFRTKESRNLSACLSKSGKMKEWSPDTEGLRSQLNEAYRDYVAKAEDFLAALNKRVVKEVAGAYGKALGGTDKIRITSLPVPNLPLPVSLMRTMSIDLRASSSLEWLRRKLDKSIYIEQFEATLSEDSKTVVTEACQEGIYDYFVNVQEQFELLLDEHFETIDGIRKTGEEALETRLKEVLGQDQELTTRLSTLRDVGDILHALETDIIDSTESAELDLDLAQ